MTKPRGSAKHGRRFRKPELSRRQDIVPWEPNRDDEPDADVHDTEANRAYLAAMATDPKCSRCGASLWAAASVQRGFCERCRLDESR